jgi:putative ABC transport system ATP-binding protein
MITLSGLTKYFNYNSINQVLALDAIDLSIAKGDFITIIGSNGAGKSTFLNCLAGTHLPDSGSLILNGSNISNWPEHKRARFIGRVFQNPLTGTCASLSIEQNLALAIKRGDRRGIGPGVKVRHRQFFEEKLQILALGLENRLKASVGLLSGGQRQALTVLMATLVQPEILLLDEHTAALDPKTARQIIALTRDLVERQQLTTLMVTHNMNQALELGNRLIMFHRGKVIFDIQGREKERLNKEDLLNRFYDLQGEEFTSDRMLLA